MGLMTAARRAAQKKQKALREAKQEAVIQLQPKAEKTQESAPAKKYGHKKSGV